MLPNREPIKETMEAKILKKKYPVVASSYTLLEEVGQGARAIIYRAKCIPFNEIVAVKVLDLDRNINLEDLRREVQVMSLISHPNVLNSLCSFVVEHSLWVVMPYMAGGSCLDIMKSAYPDGYKKPVIATFLKECLKGLEYLHRQGYIHRDVKAEHILVDASGTVKLGVSACIFDAVDRQRTRNTFVGNPRWMAPEVLQKVCGYDFKADIWSFGITALKLAHGYAALSKYPSIKMSMALRDNCIHACGCLYGGDKCSQLFKEMVAMCFIKNPAKRPPAYKLLRHGFFEHARSSEYLLQTVLHSVVPLPERFHNFKMKDAEMLAQKEMMFGKKEERSQSEHNQGGNGWSFNIEDLRSQALSRQGDYACSVGKEEQQQINMSSEAQSLPSLSLSQLDCNEAQATVAMHSPVADTQVGVAMHSPVAGVMTDRTDVQITTAPSAPLHSTEQNVPESPIEYFSYHEDEDDTLVQSAHKGNQKVEEERERLDRENKSILQLEGKDISSQLNRPGHQECNDPLEAEHAIGVSSHNAHKKDLHRVSAMMTDNSVRTRPHRKERSLSGPLCSYGLPDHHFMNEATYTPRQLKDGLDKALIIQKRGRFSVTPADIEVAEALPQLQRTAAPSPNERIATSGIISCLQTLLQCTITRRDIITRLINTVHHGNFNEQIAREAGTSHSFILPELTSHREEELLQQVVNLKNRLAILVDELQAAKQRNMNLEWQLNAIYNKEEEHRMQKEDEPNQPR